MYPRIRNLREDNDLTQRDIADILSYTHSSYAKIERGERVLSAEVLIKLSNFYNVSIDYLLGQTDYPYRLQNKK